MVCVRSNVFYSCIFCSGNLVLFSVTFVCLYFNEAVLLLLSLFDDIYLLTSNLLLLL